MLCQAAFQRANVLGYELIHSCLPTVILGLPHLRTSNPIESIFSGVKLQTDPDRRVRCRMNALYLVFKMLERLSSPSSQYSSLEGRMARDFSQ